MWTPPPQASPFPGGEKEMPGHVVPTYNTCSNTNRGFDRLRLRYVGASSSRVRLATPDGPSQRISHGRPFFRLLPLRLPRPLPSCPPGASPCHRPSRGRRRRSPLLLLRRRHLYFWFGLTRLTAAGSHPTPGTMICADCLKLCFNAVWTG